MRRRKVQPKRKATKSRTPSKKSPKPPVPFSEMILNWVIVVIAIVILVFLSSMIYRFFTDKQPAILTDSSPQIEEQLREVPRIEVLNGCGVSKIAAKFTDYLRDQNYDVVKTENYRNFDVDSSFVIDRRSMNNAYAKRLAEALGISMRLARPLLSEEMNLEATLVLGKDYKSLNGYSEVIRE